MTKWPRAIRVLSKLNLRDDKRRVRAADIGAFVQLGFPRGMAKQFVRALQDPEAMEKLLPSQQLLLREFRVGVGGLFASGGLVALRQARYERWHRAAMRLRLRGLQAERLKESRAKMGVAKGAITRYPRKGRPSY